MDGLGDVDDDEHSDFVVSAGYGTVHVYSGKDASLLYAITDIAMGEALGAGIQIVAGLGDLDLDGCGDFIVGDPQDCKTQPGSARIFSGKTGSHLKTMVGSVAADGFGSSVHGPGDINDDGFADVIIGSPGSNSGATIGAGNVTVYSGLWINHGTGEAVLQSMDGATELDRLGVSICSLGNIDVDGYGDIVATAVAKGFGKVVVFSSVPLSLTADTQWLSVGAASAQKLSIDVGVDHALKNYWVFTNFAASGNSPGVTVAPGVTLPLNPDVLTDFVISQTQFGAGSPTFMGWRGTLDTSGRGAASLNTFGPVPVAVGITLNHAALVYTADGCGVGCDKFHLATNAVPLTTVP